MRNKNKVSQIIIKHKLNLLRAANENIFILLVQYIGTVMSITYSRHCLLAAGTSLGFIFLRGPIILPGIIIGIFIAYLMHAPMMSAFFATITLALQTYAIYVISYALRNPTLVFNKISLYIDIMIVIASITLLSSLLLTYISLGLLDENYFLYIWFVNLNGSLIFAFGIVTWSMYFPDIIRIHIKELGLYATLLSFYSYFYLKIFQYSYLHSSHLIFLWLASLSILLFVSHRFGQCGALLSMMFMMLLTILFKSSTLNSPQWQQIILVQFLLYLQFVLALTYAILRYNQSVFITQAQES